MYANSSEASTCKQVASIDLYDELPNELYEDLKIYDEPFSTPENQTTNESLSRINNYIANVALYLLVERRYVLSLYFWVNVFDLIVALQTIAN